MLKVKGRGTSSLRLDSQKWHGIKPKDFRPQIIDRPHDVSGNNLLGSARWIEPIEYGLPRLEVMHVNPSASFSIDTLNFSGGTPSARLSYFRVGITGIDSPWNI